MKTEIKISKELHIYMIHAVIRTVANHTKTISWAFHFNTDFFFTQDCLI